MVRYRGRRDNTRCQHTWRASLGWGDNVGCYQGWGRGLMTWGDPVWGQGLSRHVAVCGDMGRPCVLPCRGAHMECPRACVGTHGVQVCPQIYNRT